MDWFSILCVYGVIGCLAFVTYDSFQDYKKEIKEVQDRLNAAEARLQILLEKLEEDEK